MKHRLKSIKLGKDRKHRLSMLRNLSTSLLQFGHIQTTITKAKQLRPFVEKLIHRAKQDTIHNRRMAYRHIKNKTILKKLFESIGLRYQNRKGGYTKIYKLHRRKGDDAPLVYMELVPETIVSKDGTEQQVDVSEKKEPLKITSVATEKNETPSVKKEK